MTASSSSSSCAAAIRRRSQARRALIRGDRATADATALHKAMAGADTDRKALFGALEKLNGDNVMGVMDAYQKQYGESLEAAIKGEWLLGFLSGDKNKASTCSTAR